MLKAIVTCSVAAALVSISARSAAEDVAIETVLTDLSAPNGVAVRPGGTPENYEIFVADSGARRVIKMASDQSSRSTDVITDFPAAAIEVMQEGNPVGLYFLDRERLVAAVAGTPPGIRLYELADAELSLSADEARQRVTPEPPEEDAQFQHGRIVGLARTRANDVVSDMLLVATNRLWKLPIRAGTLSEMVPFDTKSSGLRLRQTALAISEQGYIVVAEAQPTRQTRTDLVFLNPATGEVVMQVLTELGVISGLAYSPTSKNLYAVGASDDSRVGEGVFRIDDYDVGDPSDRFRRRATRAVKIADAPRPRALAFGPDGALYVTALHEDMEGKWHGVLLKITGEL